MTGAPRFLSNDNIHKDLRIPKVKKEFERIKLIYLQKLRNHTNVLARPLANLSTVSRLRRADMPPFD